MGAGGSRVSGGPLYPGAPGFLHVGLRVSGLGCGPDRDLLHPDRAGRRDLRGLPRRHRSRPDRGALRPRGEVRPARERLAPDGRGSAPDRPLSALPQAAAAVASLHDARSRSMRVFLALLILAIAGCSDRERSNPFDPSNPLTRGAPADFAALAGDGRIDLRWQTVSGDGLVGYRLYRRTAAESAFTALSAVLPPHVGTYADLGLLNGLEHHYRIYYVFAEGDRDPPAEDVAAPGRVRPWVVDARQGKLLRLT